jgi:hypothetical protein
MHSLSQKLVITAAGFIVALALFGPAMTQGGETDLRTVFSVSHQFTVPGKVLEPDTDYVMMVGDAHTGMRRVVRIFNSDESELLTTFLAINDERTEPVDKTTFTFLEMDEGQPQVVRSWFYPGRSIGLEFVYPKEQALQIAQHAKETVLATAVDLAALDEERGIDVDADLSELEDIEVVSIEPGESSREIETTAAVEDQTLTSDAIPPLVEPDSAAIVEQESETTVTLNEPVEPPLTDEDLLASEQEAEPAPVEMAQNRESEDLKADAEIVREKPAEPQSSVESDSESLPATAGTLPIVGLVGGLSLAMGVGIRFFRAG